jgi:RNA recognition motif-containing protein
MDATDPQEVTRQTILSTARLFVRNLTFSCTTEELQEHFGRFGQLDQVSFEYSFFFLRGEHRIGATFFAVLYQILLHNC